MLPDGRVQHVNQRFLQLMGYSAEEVRNKHHKQFCFDETVESPEYLRFWAGLRNGQSVDGKILRRRSDGGAIWLQAIYTPVLSPQGEVQRILKVAMDVTEAQTVKIEAEGQLAALSKSTGIIEFTPDGTILRANERLLGYFGYTEDDVIGMPHRILCPVNYAESVEYRAFWDRLRSGQHVSGIFRRVSSIGRRIWISASYNPIVDAQGRVVRIIKFVQNITEEHESGLLGRQQIASLRSSQAVVDFDTDGTIIDVNAVFLEKIGRQREEVIGAKFETFFSEDGDALFENDFQSVWSGFASGNVPRAELMCRTRNAGELWFHASFNVIVDVDNQPVMVSMIGLDATAERMAANEMFARDAAIDSAFLRLDFDMDGNVLSMNPRARELYGFRGDDVAWRSLGNRLAPGSDAAIEYANLWNQLREGHVVSGRFRRMTRDGRIVWLEGAYSPISDLSGRPVRVIAYGTDVTQRIEIEAYIDSGIVEINEAVGRLTHHLSEVRR